MRKLRPTLLGLTLGAVALWIFFAWLFTLFRSERDDAAREAGLHQVALEAYALAELTSTLRSQLAVASDQLDDVRRDPLLDDSGLFLATGDVQVVPALPAKETPVDPLAPDSPAARRAALADEIDEAVTRKDRTAIERLTRELLAERARYVVPMTVDVPVVLRVISSLQRAGPSPELLRMLLRDGVSQDGRVPQGLEGLQRALLRRRVRLSDTQLAQLCAEVAKVSREVHVPAADFEARCQTRPSPRPPAWQLPEGESLWKGAQVWFVRLADGRAEGVAVELPVLVGELTGRLRSRGLLSARDSLAFELPAGASALSALTMRLEAPEWRESARRRDERFVVKSVLLGVSAAMTLGVVALAVLAQRRKLKFVELKSDFVATVSHELRTPLASMRVMAETLERRLEGHPGAKDYPARIVREVDGLSLLVDNILSFNRLDKGRWQRREGRVGLGSLVPLLVSEAERYPAAKVELAFDGFEGASLDADSELLALLLLNLLRNACKYNARDPVQVRFSCEGTTLRVRDNGVGIAPADWESVFVEFNRLPGQHGRGGAGSGLGLALARRIMALHRGTIAVERSDAEGTTFVMKFP